MPTKFFKRIHISNRILAYFLAAFFVSGSAHALQDDRHLEELFSRLASEKDERRAQALESAIWETWLDADSPSINLLMERSRVALESDDVPTALSLLNAIVDLRPDFPEGWNKRATLFFILEDYDQSMVDIQKTLELEPRHFGALAGMSSILSAHGKHEEALKVYRRALTLNPFLPDSAEHIKTLLEKIEGRKI